MFFVLCFCSFRDALLCCLSVKRPKVVTAALSLVLAATVLVVHPAATVDVTLAIVIVAIVLIMLVSCFFVCVCACWCLCLFA